MIRKIILLKLWFTDLSKYKIRPVLIIKEYENNDFLFLPLTSNLKKKGFLLKEEDLENGELKKDSVIIIPKISICHESLIIKEIAKLKQNVFLEIKKSLCKNLGCRN